MKIYKNNQFSAIDLKGYKNEDSELITIEASCVTGFELAATYEVKRKLGIENVHEIMGRVVFDIPLSKLNQVMKLRTIDNIWVIIGAKSDFDFSLSEEESIKNISDFTLNHLLWNKGLKAWNSVFEFYENLEDFQAEKRPKLEDKIPKFRCTCYRTGENVHKFSSMDVAKNVGGQIQEKFQWSVKMKDFDIEVVVNIDSNQAYFGIGLTHQSLYKRNIEHFGPTTLRATICASMLELADIQPGEIVVDPMCGGGSIPIEGAVAFKNGFFLAGDYHDLASQRTGNNLKVNRTRFFLKIT